MYAVCHYSCGIFKHKKYHWFMFLTHEMVVSPIFRSNFFISLAGLCVIHFKKSQKHGRKNIISIKAVKYLGRNISLLWKEYSTTWDIRNCFWQMKIWKEFASNQRIMSFSKLKIDRLWINWKHLLLLSLKQIQWSFETKKCIENEEKTEIICLYHPLMSKNEFEGYKT